MSVVSADTWNYLNPFFHQNDDSSTWSGDSGEGSFTVSGGISTETEASAIGAYDSLLRSQSSRPMGVKRRVKTKKIVIQARSAPPPCTRRPDAPGIASIDLMTRKDKDELAQLSRIAYHNKGSTVSRENHSPGCMERSLPKPPSLDCEIRATQFETKYDLPRPPSLVYEYRIVSDRK